MHTIEEWYAYKGDWPYACQSCGYKYGPYPYGQQGILVDGSCTSCGKTANLLEQYQKDLEDAAGELLLPVPEPGTPMAKLMVANNLLRQENEKLRHELIDLKST